jgi:hypothetical protein
MNLILTIFYPGKPGLIPIKSAGHELQLTNLKCCRQQHHQNQNIKKFPHYQQPLIASEKRIGLYSGLNPCVFKKILILPNPKRYHGRVVRQRSAKPCTAVRLRLVPLRR